jgi:hypothetical protein
MLLLACSFATAADYMRIDVDTLYENSSNSIPFYILRECPDPAKIMGCSNGFVLNAVGNATWSYPTGISGPHYEPFSDHLTIWNLGGLLFTNNIDGAGMTSGWFLTGGAAMPPAGGMPVYTSEKHWFTLHTFDIGDLPAASTGDGIEIDSAFVGSAGAWKWSGLTCGQGGGPDRPLFLDKYGNDKGVHPHFLPVLEVSCVDPTIDVTPTGDMLSTDVCGTASFQFGAQPGFFGTTPATITGWAVVSGIGNIDNNGMYTASVAPTDCGIYDVCIEVYNDCGGVDMYCFQVEFLNSDPYFIGCPDNCGSDLFQVGMGNPFYLAVNVDDPDDCQQIFVEVYQVVTMVGDPFEGTAVMNGLTLEVNTTMNDGEKEICVILRVYDEQLKGVPGEAFCDVGIKILSSDPFEIQIDKLHDVYQGHYAFVGIWLNKGSEAFGGFDFLIAYDASALIFMEAQLGAFLDGCWEYFTYRYNWNGNCGGPCPTGMLRVVGIADINNGPNHPDPGCLRHPGGLDPVQLVVLTFYVTNDRTFECMYVPIRFFWHDCGDNALSNIMGDTLWISRYVYTYEMVDITGTIHYGGHWWLGDCQNPDPEKPWAIPFIDFIHGGVDIICSDSIDARGDLNLNNIANEIADAVLYTNYFIYGLGVFNINPEGQIAASDVNNDGRVLTVGDLVYLVRLITGDELAYPKLSPYANTVDVTYGDVVTSNSDVALGAGLFVFDGTADIELLAEGMELKSDIVDGQLRVLVWSDNTGRINSGLSDIFAVNGDVNLVEVSVSDYYGNMMNVNTAERVLPTSYALLQNYPNPFNPSTDITIVLPEPSQYRLDIFNVAGQLVDSYSGYGVNEVTVTVNADKWASGIYFYKATAGQFTATKKMVLMK